MKMGKINQQRISKLPVFKWKPKFLKKSRLDHQQPNKLSSQDLKGATVRARNLVEAAVVV